MDSIVSHIWEEVDIILAIILDIILNIIQGQSALILAIILDTHPWQPPPPPQGFLGIARPQQVSGGGDFQGVSFVKLYTVYRLARYRNNPRQILG